jgi:hypothetical protein
LTASCATVLLLLAGRAAAADEQTWRITHARAAPWATSASPAGAALAAQVLALRGGALQGPPPLACAPARVQAMVWPAAGLFEGQLAKSPDPAAAAHALGLGRLPARGLRITCPNASFDLVQTDRPAAWPGNVQADRQGWLLALDQRLWTLTTAPAARAAFGTPAGVVQRLLERHFAAPHGGEPRGFTPALVVELSDFITTDLRMAADRWLAAPHKPDEVPSINGDVITDSQELVLRFGLQAPSIRQGQAEVPVRMADAERAWTLLYRLRREAGQWRVDDLRLGDGTTLRTLLKDLP